VARQSSTGLYAQSLKQVLSRSAAPGTIFDIHGLSAGAAIADQYRYIEHLDTQEILSNGLRAEQAGYDAFLIGNIFSIQACTNCANCSTFQCWGFANPRSIWPA
jgi:hypothetical protein